MAYGGPKGAYYVPQGPPKCSQTLFGSIGKNRKIDFSPIFGSPVSASASPCLPQAPQAPCIQTACIYRGHWASPVQVPFWRGVKPWKSGSRGKNGVWGAAKCLLCPPRTPKVFPNTFWIDWKKSKKSIFSPIFDPPRPPTAWRLPWAPCIQTACIHRGHWASPVQVPFWRGVKPWKSGSRGKNDVWGAERCLVCPPRTPKVFPNTFWIDLRKSKKSIFSPFFHRYLTFLRKFDFSEKI